MHIPCKKEYLEIMEIDFLYKKSTYYNEISYSEKKMVFAKENQTIFQKVFNYL